MKQALITMLELQDAMNSKVHPQWREQGNEWYRAIWVECAELLDHYGWKWWKAQAPDMEQVELELIDIWHFGISIALENSADYESIAEDLNAGLDFSDRDSDFKVAIEEFAANTLTTKNFDIRGFSALLVLSGLSFDGLFRRYVAKNVLNMFRQDHGYKDGTYIKVWSGKEDNEHLMEVLAGMNAENLSKESLYSALETRYQAIA